MDTLFVVLPYTGAMLSQGANLVDAAVEAGVSHIVHLASYIRPKQPSVTLVPFFRWHDLLENYIERAGPNLKYTHLRAGKEKKRESGL